MKKITKLIALSVMTAAPAFATPPTLSDISYEEAGGNYYCYPYLKQTPPAQTPAPEGYVPFHMEHYGRHGSRWLIGDYQYNTAVDLLGKADRNGKLTPLGMKTYEAVKQIREASQRRDGELSDNGALQHKGIGERMAKNYPQIFNHRTNIDARSTIVIRSILSMFNGLKGIQSVVPNVNITTDASEADMWYMNYWDEEFGRLEQHVDSVLLHDFQRRHANKGEYLSKLISDPQFAKDSIGDRLFNPLYSVLVNAQSHSDQPWLVEEVFTPEEARERWMCRNAGWFVHNGNSKVTNHRMPFKQANLLRNIIESADTAIVSSTPSANLRYGHDTIIMPLTALLELDQFGEEINDLEELASKGWHDYLSIPMAGNIQMVFYRKPGSLNPEDVLVKVLLNERETTLPVDRNSGPYYKWTDFRNYYLNKLNQSSN